MIVFLNYLPTIVFVGGLALTLWFFLKDKREAMVISGIVSALLLIVLKAVTPSYMPKGEVPKMPITMPEARELPPMVDRTLKPEMTNEERAKQFDQKFDAVKQSQ